MSEKTVLEIDIGNSRAKWRVVLGENDLLRGLERHDDLRRMIDAQIKSNSIEEVRFVSVLGQEFNADLRSWLKENSVEKVGVASVTEKAAGVICGYDSLDQLGIDRWLAVLAAANEFSQPLVVVDFGTAVTLDLVDKQKQHHGGYIFPGWELLQKALVEGTAINSERIPAKYRSDLIEPGKLSQDAIGQGRLLAISAAVDNAVNKFAKQQKDSVLVVCTGGYASYIIPHLESEALLRPDLVLDGLKFADLEY